MEGKMKKYLLLALVISCAASAWCHNLNSNSRGVVFAVIGDFGANTRAEKNVAKALKAKHPDFILTVGDNNYPKGCWSSIDKNIGQYYASFIANYKGKYGNGSEEARFFPSLGNHDWYAKSKCLHHGSLPYLEYFTLPGNQRYYDFQKGPVHFFALDSDGREPDGIKIGSKQYLWFVEKLKKSTATFKIVYFHHAAFSSARHGSTKQMQWDFSSLGIDGVFSGHDHSYERIVRDNVVYFVNGVGGNNSLSKLKKRVAGSQYFYNKKHGFMLVNVNSNEMHIQFINKDNHIKDEYFIKK
jgi:tartrate-resistant acid phosphatase type 5